MHTITDVVDRLKRGQSDRAIARDLGLSRVTVRKYHELMSAGKLDELVAPLPDRPPARNISTVLPYQEIVERLLVERVTIRTIYERLRDNHSYTGSYGSVLRFVQHRRAQHPRLTIRVHTGPGEEAQVDFGSAGQLFDPARQRLRTAYIFVMTLSYSRHQYAEIVFDQKIPTWLALHRRAFASFGGLPHKVVLDNLKAAVLKAALHDPVLGEAYRRFARHYGFLVSPNRPRTPRHKGKVEAGVKFVKRSFLAAQQFADIHDANRRLAIWVRERAGSRDHGTTHQPPLVLFETVERARLLPLPADPFELTNTVLVKLHPDCHVTIDGSFYSAPFRYVGEQLEAFVFERVVQLYKGTELLATHVRARERGAWRTNNDHLPPDKIAYLQKTPVFCREVAFRIGPATFEVVNVLLGERPLDKLRSVQAILRLTDSVGKTRLEAACRRALFYGDPRYRRIKDILNAALDQQPLPGPEESPALLSYAFARSAEELFGTQVQSC